MSAAIRINACTFRSFVSFLEQMIGLSRRSRTDPDRPDPSKLSKIDLGDLAVAQLVHDLRNQLTVITSCADNLEPSTARGDLTREITLLRRYAARASVLTREILLAARPKFSARRPLDLNHVIDHGKEMISRMAGDAVTVTLRLSPIDVPVVAEFIELERIVLNLVLNSLDAITDEGTITIETEAVRSPSPSRVEGMQDGPYARLTVTDTGRGVTSDVRSRMFEPFFTTKQTGTGLGLSSVAFTVRQLDGTLAVDSEPGRGTSITVLLPLAG